MLMTRNYYNEQAMHIKLHSVMSVTDSLGEWAWHHRNLFLVLIVINHKSYNGKCSIHLITDIMYNISGLIKLDNETK